MGIACSGMPCRVGEGVTMKFPTPVFCRFNIAEWQNNFREYYK